MNKLGEERVVSVYMFGIWILIAISIAVSAFLFVGNEADLKQAEAEVLVDRLSDCIIKYNSIDSFIVNNEDIFDTCNLNKKYFDDEIFYFEVNFIDIETDESVFESISYGNPEFRLQCELRESARARNFARCSDEKIYTISDGEPILLSIFTGSNNKGGRF